MLLVKSVGIMFDVSMLLMSLRKFEYKCKGYVLKKIKYKLKGLLKFCVW